MGAPSPAATSGGRCHRDTVRRTPTGRAARCVRARCRVSPAPIDQRPQGPVPPLRPAWPVAEQREPAAVEASADFGEGERARSRSCQFQGQREPVEPPDARRAAVAASSERRRCAARGAHPAGRRVRWHRLRAGGRRPRKLPRRARAAPCRRCQDARSAHAAEQHAPATRLVRLIDDVLAVIEDDEGAAAGERSRARGRGRKPETRSRTSRARRMPRPTAPATASQTSPAEAECQFDDDDLFRLPRRPPIAKSGLGPRRPAPGCVTSRLGGQLTADEIEFGPRVLPARAPQPERAWRGGSTRSSGPGARRARGRPGGPGLHRLQSRRIHWGERAHRSRARARCGRAEGWRWRHPEPYVHARPGPANAVRSTSSPGQGEAVAARCGLRWSPEGRALRSRETRDCSECAGVGGLVEPPTMSSASVGDETTVPGSTARRRSSADCPRPRSIGRRRDPVHGEAAEVRQSHATTL